jgi:hypothetical protein
MRTNYMLLFIVLIYSCKSSDTDIIKIDPNVFEDNPITLSEIADDIKYIQLDNYYPMGHIAFVKFTSKSLILYEHRYGLLAFDREGKKGKRIGDLGRGPGQYTYVHSIAIDDESENIYVMGSDKNIYVYTRNGKFLKNIPLKRYGSTFEDIEVFNSNILVSEFINVGKAKYNWIIIDSLGNLISEKKNSIPPFSSGGVGGGGLYKYENTLSYWNMYNDTVFKIFPDLDIKTSLIIKPGSFRIPRSRSDVDQNTNILIPYFIFETSRFFIFQYSYLQKITIALIEKNSKKSYLSYISLGKDGRNLLGGIPNDLDGGIGLIPQFYYEENGQEYLIGIIEALQLKTHLSTDEFKKSSPKYSEKKAELEGIGSTMNEGDNPIIVVARLKKNKTE